MFVNILNLRHKSMQLFMLLLKIAVTEVATFFQKTLSLSTANLFFVYNYSNFGVKLSNNISSSESKKKSTVVTDVAYFLKNISLFVMKEFFCLGLFQLQGNNFKVHSIFLIK